MRARRDTLAGITAGLRERRDTLAPGARRPRWPRSPAPAPAAQRREDPDPPARRPRPRGRVAAAPAARGRSRGRSCSASPAARTRRPTAPARRATTRSSTAPGRASAAPRHTPTRAPRPSRTGSRRACGRAARGVTTGSARTSSRPTRASPWALELLDSHAASRTSACSTRRATRACSRSRSRASATSCGARSTTSPNAGRPARIERLRNDPRGDHHGRPLRRRLDAARVGAGDRHDDGLPTAATTILEGSRTATRSTASCRRKDRCCAFGQNWSSGGARAVRLALMSVARCSCAPDRLLLVARDGSAQGSSDDPAVDRVCADTGTAEETEEEYTERICAPRRSRRAVPGGPRAQDGGRRQHRQRLPQGLAGDHRRAVEGHAAKGTHRKAGGDRNDELLGHHGNDTVIGGDGKDVLWGDWELAGNGERSPTSSRGGDGNDFLYPSHGKNTMYGGDGNDRIIAYYGHGRSTAARARATTRRRAGRAAPTRSRTASTSATSARSAQSPTATARSPARTRSPCSAVRPPTRSLLAFLDAW